MAMYRDSQLGLCIDILGPDGNVYNIWAVGNDLARQLDQGKEWRDTVEAAKRIGANYVTMLNIFREFFPMVTLIGYDEVVEKEHE